VLTGEQAAEQDVSPIIKTAENSEKEETLLNFSKPAVADSKKKRAILRLMNSFYMSPHRLRSAAA
jgi:hypothetical protein